ncbi:MAG: DAK2 domain-containing protein [Firmicutes bacterium]|nr:DAK2 domain-containing protein [Bacillota bacterium]
MNNKNNGKTMDGNLLRRLLISGFENLARGSNYLNDINVYPVSDGDTGTNMNKTFKTGIGEITPSPSFSAVLSSFVQGMLLGSRGNSGSILSQFFLGIYEHTKGLKEANAADLCGAFISAYKAAYKAVLQPAEGTMLTVMRESAEKTKARLGADVTLKQFFDIYTDEIYSSVRGTTDMMDILRENNVVDSGGAGFYLIFDGIKKGLYDDHSGDEAESLFPQRNGSFAKTPLPYRYCTEFLLKMRKAKTDEYFVNLLKNQGDSLIVTVSGETLKVHIHTDEPQNILDRFSKLGDFAETKIDDMFIQQEINQPVKRTHDGYIIVSFAHGDGIISLLEELGCDVVFSVPQNYHIGEDSFHFFINKFINEKIILLPNAENIYNAALTLYPPDKYPNIHIINSQDVVKTYFFLSFMLNTDRAEKVLKTFAELEMERFFGAKILSVSLAGEKFFVGFTADRTIINENLEELLKDVASDENLKDIATVVVFHGQTAKENEIEVVAAHFSQFEDIDFAMMDGKQDDFDYIIGAM